MPSHVMTLIGAGISANDIARKLGAAVEWLAPDHAADIAFDGDPARAAQLVPPGMDAVIQPIAGRRKSLLVADMESTAIQNEMLDEMADLIGIGDAVATITRRAMNGELDPLQWRRSNAGPHYAQVRCKDGAGLRRLLCFLAHRSRCARFRPRHRQRTRRRYRPHCGDPARAGPRRRR